MALLGTWHTTQSVLRFIFLDPESGNLENCSKEVTNYALVQFQGSMTVTVEHHVNQVKQGQCTVQHEHLLDVKRMPTHACQESVAHWQVQELHPDHCGMDCAGLWRANCLRRQSQSSNQ